jgi:hypothetical protein
VTSEQVIGTANEHCDAGSRFLPLRMIVLLAAVIVCVAAVSCWALGGVVPVKLLPRVVSGLALVLAVFLAPLFPAPGRSSPQTVGEIGWLVLARLAFAALWQAAALGFVLLVLSRLTPLSSGAVVQASVWLGLCAFGALLLAACTPRAYAGLMFGWLVVLPVCGYFAAELFMSGPAGSMGWGQAPAAFRGAMHWMLSLSPGAALDGAVTGWLADGTEFRCGVPIALMCIFDVALAWVVARRRDVALFPPRSLANGIDK